MSSESPNRVTACVVTFNNERTISQCLLSALEQSRIDLDIIVVDNASSDSTRDIVRGVGTDRVSLVEQSSNLGFAAAMNLAIERARAPFVLLLNPDVFLEPMCVATLTAHLADRDIAAVQPKLLLDRDERKGIATIDSVGVRVDFARIDARDIGHGLADRGQWNAVRGIFGPTGACALWRRDALLELKERTGIFDERFFAYYEDVDLAWRATRHGYRFSCVPEAVAIHARKNPPHHGVAVDARAFANRWLLFAKNASGARLIRLLPRFALFDLPRLVARTIRRGGHGVAWRRLFLDIPRALLSRRAPNVCKGS
ncbi:MAG: glycosyltransferase family 2 protein [Deltaproteobacteria bacterium]|nr:glycosyltransferase family 2 protein [Deltaproteobacteria bacterium]